MAPSAIRRPTWRTVTPMLAIAAFGLAACSNSQESSNVKGTTPPVWTGSAAAEGTSGSAALPVHTGGVVPLTLLDSWLLLHAARPNAAIASIGVTVRQVGRRIAEGAIGELLYEYRVYEQCWLNRFLTAQDDARALVPPTAGAGLGSSFRSRSR